MGWSHPSFGFPRGNHPGFPRSVAWLGITKKYKFGAMKNVVVDSFKTFRCKHVDGFLSSKLAPTITWLLQRCLPRIFFSGMFMQVFCCGICEPQLQGSNVFCGLQIHDRIEVDDLFQHCPSSIPKKVMWK